MSLSRRYLFSSCSVSALNGQGTLQLNDAVSEAYLFALSYVMNRLTYVSGQVLNSSLNRVKPDGEQVSQRDLPDTLRGPVRIWEAALVQLPPERRAAGGN